MSWLSKGLHKLEHVITAPAKGLLHAVEDPVGWAENIGHQATDPKTLLGLAATLALPGVGGALGGALGAIPGVGGALASGAGAVGSALGSLGGAAKGALSAIPGASGVAGAIEGAAGALPGASSLGSSSLGGLVKEGLGKAGEFLTANGGRNALGIAQGVTTALQQKKANDLANRALKSSEGAYAEKAPLRAAGMAGLMRPDVGNPYYARSA